MDLKSLNKHQKHIIDISPFPVSSKFAIADKRADKIAKDILGTCYGRLLQGDVVGFNEVTHRPIRFDLNYFKTLIYEIKEALQREYIRIHEHYYNKGISRLIINTPIIPHKSGVKKEAERHAKMIVTELLKIAQFYDVEFGELKLVIDRLRMSALDKEYTNIMHKFRYGIKGVKADDKVVYF